MPTTVPMTKRGGFIALLLLSPAASRGRAGVIHGQVEVPLIPPAAPRTTEPYAGGASSLPQPRVPVRGTPQDAVICIESVPAGADSLLPDPGARPRLAQQDQSFVPRVVAVPAGGVVDFLNLDPIYHNVFSVSPAKRFDLGRYGRGMPDAGDVEVDLSLAP